MLRIRQAAFAAMLSISAPVLAQQRLVIIDQDGSGPGGSNQMAMMVLLQSQQVKVLGITMVSGNAWEPEEVQHTLRMLELIHRSDAPVVPGAIFPLLHTELESKLERPLVGTQPWYGAWGDLSPKDTAPKDKIATSGEPYHGPYVVPPLVEGKPKAKPLDEDAAHFLIRQVRAHPHQVTIYAAGPLTNIALAIAIDPQFAELTAGIAIMGGSLNPVTDDPEYATHPRHEFNFWFDPEAVHIVLRAPFPRIDLTTVDISLKTHFTKAMVEEIAKSANPAAQYIAKYSDDPYYMWDELEAAALLDPAIITKEQVLYLDVDLNHGPNYGDTLSWTEVNQPQIPLQRVHVQTDLDVARFYRLFVELMKAPPVVQH